MFLCAIGTLSIQSCKSNTESKYPVNAIISDNISYQIMPEESYIDVKDKSSDFQTFNISKGELILNHNTLYGGNFESTTLQKKFTFQIDGAQSIDFDQLNTKIKASFQYKEFSESLIFLAQLEADNNTVILESEEFHSSDQLSFKFKIKAKIKT